MGEAEGLGDAVAVSVGVAAVVVVASGVATGASGC